MDWSRESILNIFMVFILGEINEIENVLKLADSRNHLEMALNKIWQALIDHQLSTAVVQESLLEQSKVSGLEESSKL